MCACVKLNVYFVETDLLISITLVDDGSKAVHFSAICQLLACRILVFL